MKMQKQRKTVPSSPSCGSVTSAVMHHRVKLTLACVPGLHSGAAGIWRRWTACSDKAVCAAINGTERRAARPMARLHLKKPWKAYLMFTVPSEKSHLYGDDFDMCESPALEKLNPHRNPRYGWNDIGNSNLFADYYNSIARYVPERKQWFMYDGKAWRGDIGNLKVMSLCKRLANKLLVYALSIKEERSRKDYIEYISKWQMHRYRETILKICGEYGRTCRSETIGMKPNGNGSAPSEDIARLAGARFVNISEPDKRLMLSAALLKTLTGSDTVNARFLHENSFDFKPQFKIFTNTNYLPTITDLTLLTSGHVKIIPFERHFEEYEQDLGLKDEFSRQENLSGILN